MEFQKGRYFNPTIPHTGTDIRAFFRAIVFRFILCFCCGVHCEKPWQELKQFRANPKTCESIYCQSCFARICKSCIRYRGNTEIDSSMFSYVCICFLMF